MILWASRSRPRVYRSTLGAAGLETERLGSGLDSLVALLDYDGDGTSNVIGYRLDGRLADLQTGAVFDVTGCALVGAGDLDGDGLQDLAGAHGVWFGAPSGFIEGPAFDTSADTVDCPTVHPLGDIDRDGRADLARASFSPIDSYAGGPSSALDLHFGADLGAAAWPARWRYEDPERSTARALTAADVDGDGDDELVTLTTARLFGGLSCEMHILDDLSAPAGPTVLARADMGGSVVEREWQSLSNVGDLDGDGDDEILAVIDGLLDRNFLRLLDAEPSEQGLYLRMDETLELQLPVGVGLEDAGSPGVRVVDIDGDGYRDVVAAFFWEALDGRPDGVIALWLLDEASAIQGPTPPPEPSPPTQSSPEEHTQDEVASQRCGCGVAPGVRWPLVARRR